MAEYSTQPTETPQVSYLTTDHLGSARIITDENGQITNRKDYAAFGDETITANRTSALKYSAPDEVRKCYTGYEKDDESGLDFAQARYYNSMHGRFTSIDPLTASADTKNPQTFNRYSYVLNSPYKFVDPLGLISENTGACGKGCANSDGGMYGMGIGLYTANGQTIQIGHEQQAEPPAPPPAPQQNGVTTASSVTPTVKLDNAYIGILKGEGTVLFTLPDNEQAELQKKAEEAEQNQMAYLRNRDAAVKALREAWYYQDEQNFDLWEDVWNMDDIPPSFITPGGQVITSDVPTTNGGYSAGSIGVPAGNGSSFGDGSGKALADAANGNLAQVNSLRSNAAGENHEKSRGTVYVTVTKTNGTQISAYLLPGFMQTLHKNAVWKGIEAANKRYAEMNK